VSHRVSKCPVCAVGLSGRLDYFLHQSNIAYLWCFMMPASWYDSKTLRLRQHCWLSRCLMERVNICSRSAAFVRCRGFNCLSYVASTYHNFVKKFSDLLSFLIYVMKECRALVVYHHLFLTSALDGSEYWRSRPGNFKVGGESQYPLWVGRRAGVGVLKKRKSLAPAGNPIIITRRPARSLVTILSWPFVED